MYWASACSLPFLLSDPVTRSKLSPHEVDFLKAYAAMTIEFRSQFEGDVDITSSIEDIPRDLHVWVKVKRPDCGVIETENGRIDFRMGQRYLVSKSDVEHLVAQGYLEIVD
jgi:GINS complex subunit 1